MTRIEGLSRQYTSVWTIYSPKILEAQLDKDHSRHPYVRPTDPKTPSFHDAKPNLILHSHNHPQNPKMYPATQVSETTATKTKPDATGARDGSRERTPAKPSSRAMYDRELQLERISPEEKRHEAIRTSITYILLNVVSIVIAHLSIAPVLSPHEFEPVATEKVNRIAWKIFCGIWGLITGFWNLVLGAYTAKVLIEKWRTEKSEEYLNTFRIPRYDEMGENTGCGEKQDLNRGSLQDMKPSIWFIHNNPYTAARRTHSGIYAANRRARSRRLSDVAAIEQHEFHLDDEPIVEEIGDATARDVEWKDGGEVNEIEPAFEGDKQDSEHVTRSAESYPFSKDEETPSSTTWSNSATSAGEFARKRKGKGKGKKRSFNKLSKREDSARPDGFTCSSPNCTKANNNVGSSSSSSHSCAWCSASSNSWNERDAQLKKAMGQSSPSLSAQGSSNVSSGEHGESFSGQEHQNTHSRDDIPGETTESAEVTGATPIQEQPDSESSLSNPMMIKEVTYSDQQAVFAKMNKRIWNEVGEQIERQIRIESPQVYEQAKAEASLGSGSGRSWRSFLSWKKKKETMKARDEAARRKQHLRPSQRRHRRRACLVAIITGCGIMACFPPLLAIGGDILAHDYQFKHACDNARWDIKLDASGLHPEQNNIYNRAIFKDRRAKGYEREFMMNLEGMFTYGNGLDISLVDKRRGYVFYLSPKDLAHQPDNGETIRFPYPVVVAYDMFKHSYYAHDTVWRDLNDESFFDGGKFMNGTLGIFPGEGIWLEKKESSGYCGQPKRVLKNAYDQRILWTVIDDRNDCTLFRVCGSNQATRRQVVLATGMILLRLSISANCCSKDSSRISSEPDPLANPV